MQGLVDVAMKRRGLASAAGAVRAGVEAGELLLAGMRLAMPAGDGDIGQARRRVALPVDGLRHGARP